ncbi:MAG: methyltransferase domain-containing protein [Thermomicrobiales bacterium]
MRRSRPDTAFRSSPFDQSLVGLRKTRQRSPGVRIVRGDMRERLPFRDERFDAVIASLSIHYFDWKTSEGIIRELRRVLRPDGWFICRVNRVGDVNFSYGEGTEIEPEFYEVRPGHRKRFFTEDSFRRLLETGFRVDSIVPRVSTRWRKDKQTLVARAQRTT